LTNLSLPLKYRIIAACCHLSGLGWQGGVIFIRIFTDTFKFTQIAAIIVFLAFTIFPFILWLATSKIHPFVDDASRKTLSLLVMTILAIVAIGGLIISIFMISCANTSLFSPNAGTNIGFWTILLLLLLIFVVAITQGLLSLMGAILALRGREYSNLYVPRIF
jgi:uncharacterized Tic20 family protein